MIYGMYEFILKQNVEFDKIIALYNEDISFFCGGSYVLYSFYRKGMKLLEIRKRATKQTLLEELKLNGFDILELQEGLKQETITSFETVLRNKYAILSLQHVEANTYEFALKDQKGMKLFSCSLVKSGDIIECIKNILNSEI